MEGSVQSILCVAAHPDDIEHMVGGSLARWIREGRKVHVLTLTHGAWRGADGSLQRDPEVALQEERAAAATIGYSVENLRQQTMELAYQDRLVIEVLRRLEDHRSDTIVCPWDRDLHHDHEVASRIAIAASKRVPRVLMGQINSHLREVFTPNLYVDITTTWELKMRALRCYASEWDRTQGEWEAFHDELTRYYGRLVGVPRAEGFITRKYLLAPGGQVDDREKVQSR
jgi:LmbE family N-acetylglucosaminyl deacetylase